MEPELDCINPASGKADGYGELKDGFMIKCSLGLCRRLLNPKNALVKELESHFPFELTIGMNGRVWINASNPKDIILVQTAILKWEFEDPSPSQTKKFVRKILNGFSKQE
ncbi:exosome non-catalytic core subunit rrp40 [Nowakowskiella sp. JEL0078]|nr:exosome non-catalytic core subunit rrp40 [Nowakowskiella sp. JEL0078]